jgi:hypothetical protein
MRLSQEVLEMSSLSVNTQLNTTLHVSEGDCQNLCCHHLDLAPNVLPKLIKCTWFVHVGRPS